MTDMRVVLKRGRENPLLRRHPWIFSGSIAQVYGDPVPGETVEIVDAAGQFMGWGAYSPHSQIRVRVWSWDLNEEIGEEFIKSRLQHAIIARNELPELDNSQAARLIYAESDGLPGLIVDRYLDTLVMQCLTAGIEHWRETIADQLLELTGASNIYERSDADVRALEGLPTRSGRLRGAEPPEWIRVGENGLDFHVDVRQGHKTGFYLDQRTNRLRLREFSRGRTVLDCFAYTGGFTLSALKGEAVSVVAVDSSSDALEMCRQNLELNHLPVEHVEFMHGDVFQLLRAFRDARLKFDMIVLDPPKFAPTTAQVERAVRGYKDINLLAFKLLNSGGILTTFSCSGGVSEELFQKILAGAGLDAGVDARIIARMSQAGDHPVLLNFPESAYLKGFVLRVT